MTNGVKYQENQEFLSLETSIFTILLMLKISYTTINFQYFKKSVHIDIKNFKTSLIIHL